jgi:hypothetical protein
MRKSQVNIKSCKQRYSDSMTRWYDKIPAATAGCGGGLVGRGRTVLGVGAASEIKQNDIIYMKTRGVRYTTKPNNHRRIVVDAIQFP